MRDLPPGARRRAAATACLLSLALVGLPRQALGQPPARAGRRVVTGTIVDTSGAPVPGASVRVEADGTLTSEAATGSDGRFNLAAALTQLRITAISPGFAESSETIPAGTVDIDLRLVLQPAGLVESVSVTASRGASGLETPASVSVVTAGELAKSPAGAVDDVLRGTPGFSLFRRSSSRVANPTTQGVTLRGMSGSGASRTLVLADGVPLNDPFGSWVYWDRVPEAAIERIEVVRGAAGDLYGADALGGVIQVLTFGPGRARVRTSLESGSHGTARASVFAGGTRAGWTADGAAEWVSTSGVPIVAQDERGPVDVPAYSNYRSGYAGVQFTAPTWRAGLRAAAQAEDRGNGTPLQVNTTAWRQVSASAAGQAGGGQWTAQAAAASQLYFQTFSAISGARDTERLTSEQRIPTTFVTASGQWIRPLGRHALLAGVEGRRVRAEVNEIRYSLSGVPSASAVSGGTETTGSAYGRVNLAPTTALAITAGVRLDLWQPGSLDTTSTLHGATFLSPRLSVAWQASPAVAAHLAVYRASRTPTLNELYRGFRAGNVVTNPNPQLAPETLGGVEGGVLLAGGHASARLVGFFTRLSGAITNVTIQSTPALIVRQRQNTDRLRAAGLEVEAEWRPARDFVLSGVLALTASHFVDTPAQPSLQGNRVPQVPRYQAVGSVTWTRSRVATVTLNIRACGDQFDDDQNTLVLRRYAVVDASATRPLGRSLHVFAAVENLMNADYDVGRTPVRTVGWPRTVRAGVRLFLP